MMSSECKFVDLKKCTCLFWHKKHSKYGIWVAGSVSKSGVAAQSAWLPYFLEIVVEAKACQLPLIIGMWVGGVGKGMLPCEL